MKDFEANLAHLEQLTNDIKRTDISLESALKDFEEGITLAKKLEKDIEKIEGKIQ
ncbi:MAG: exodeoxyribonuclease VII small subunit, partial [Treponemataceae bacterium]|nr:exodeoxyribonuclease VII small subunit [Treponemataceae bacterium]